MLTLALIILLTAVIRTWVGLAYAENGMDQIVRFLLAVVTTWAYGYILINYIL